MLNTDEVCIRYLMREMDPAEEIEFEREMVNDQNLLIEVESLRRTYQKLGKLPLFDPPKSLVDVIKAKAVAEQSARVNRTKILVLNFAKAVASIAAALLVVSTAYYFYSGIDNQSVDQIINSQSNGIISVEPWVDRNEVIQFVGTTSQQSNSTTMDAEVLQSFDKLKLINSKTGFSAPNRRVVLTSTSQ